MLTPENQIVQIQSRTEENSALIQAFTARETAIMLEVFYQCVNELHLSQAS